MLKHNLFSHIARIDSIFNKIDYTTYEVLENIEYENKKCATQPYNDDANFINARIKRIWPVYKIDDFINLQNNISIASPFSIIEYKKINIGGVCNNYKEYKLINASTVLDIEINNRKIWLYINSSYNTINATLVNGKNNISVTILIEANYRVKTVIGSIVCTAGKCLCNYKTYYDVAMFKDNDQKNISLIATPQKIIAISMMPIDRQLLMHKEKSIMFIASTIPLLKVNEEIGEIIINKDSEQDCWLHANYSLKETSNTIYKKMDLSDIINDADNFWFVSNHVFNATANNNYTLLISDVYGDEYYLTTYYSFINRR